MEADQDESNDNYFLKRDILLRNYQLSLLEKVKKGNSIVYLPTGAGKTLIAIHLLCSKGSEIIGSYGKGGKRAFFVATTQVLVFQLKKVLQTHTKFKIGHYVGSMNVDAWSRQKWQTQFEEYNVLVLTAEILRLILQLNFIKPKNISLIVFDECHHAVFDHPYKLIIETINESNSSEAPLLLGLSAVLLNSSPKPDQVNSKIQALENLFKGKVITATQELRDILRFSADPQEKVVYYHEDESFTSHRVLKFYDSALEVLNKLKVVSSHAQEVPVGGKSFRDENKVKKIRNGIIQAKNHFFELGPFGAFLSALSFTIMFEKYRLLSLISSEIEIIVYANTELNKIRQGLQKLIGDEERENAIFRASSHKVQQLITLLANVHKEANGKPVSTLVFVHQRSTAVVLAFLLKRLSAVDKRFSFLKPEFITSSSMTRSIFFSKYNNEEVVKQFVSGSLNLLVATNLLEEGIDVSACNVVISFDFPLGYPSYFQSRGRARNKESTYYMFVKDSESHAKGNSLVIFRKIKEELFEKVTLEDSLTDDEESNDTPEKIVLQGPTNAITLDGMTAIKVVDRYCSRLPQDKFCQLTARSWYAKIGDKKKAFVQLPLSSPLHNVIEGGCRDNSKLAKRSAFLTVVKRLFEMKELDEDLCLKSFERKEEDFNNLFPYYKSEKIDKNLPQPGTRKRRQMYRVKCSEALSNCLPSFGVKAYLHVIDLTVAFNKPELQRRIAVYDVLRSPVTFAIVSSKKLRKIFQFPLFLTIGQINCDLLVNYEEIFLTKAEVNDIQTFHFGLFKKVVGVVKNCQVFNRTIQEHSFFVVPVEKNEKDRYVLQWDVIRCNFCSVDNSAVVRYNPSMNKRAKRPNCIFKNVNDSIPPEESESSKSLVSYGGISGRFLWSVNQNENNQEPKFTMTEHDYKYFVISPSYRSLNFDQFYIVGKVCHDLSPFSKFPNLNYPDYASYYQEKYGIQVTNSNQPLLKVSPIHSCLNYNKPRERKSRRARDKFREFDEHFIPEFCHVFPFDRRFWLKASLLPTVLNRLYHVYYVEEFRRKIVSETGLGWLELPEGTTWNPLKFDVPSSDSIEEENEEEKGLGVPLSFLEMKSSLPLSELKDKANTKPIVMLDPERHLYEVGLCDLEFYSKKLKLMNADDQYEEYLAQELKQNDFLIQLRKLQNVTAPVLRILNCSRNNFGPDLVLLVQASTSKSANDIVDYERLEILGDSFLKFAATFFLFRNYPDNEGILTGVKGKMVGNRNLLYCGLAKGIQDVLNVNDFVPSSDWTPPLFCVPDKLVNAILAYRADPAVLWQLIYSIEEQFTGVLSEETLRKNEERIKEFEKCNEVISNFLLSIKTVDDKTVSDCVEAFIGAYLLTLGVWGALEFLIWLGVLPRPGGSYSELIEKPFEVQLLNPAGRPAVMTLLQEVFYSDLEDTLNYRFRDKALLLEALTHPSCAKNKVTGCYQRLEFLGDAILDFLITTYVYENCGELTPGQVTDIRSALVNNVTFGCLVVRYEFHKYLLSFSSSLSKAIENFVSFQSSRNNVVDENVLIMLEENDCLIAETIQVPKALGDVFESLAGAIYLDSGNSLETVWQVYYRLMKNELEEFIKNVPKTAVKLLQEITGDKPYYECKVINERVKVSCTIYYENQEIVAHGFGQNKKEGKKSAAKVALNKIMTLKK